MEKIHLITRTFVAVTGIVIASGCATTLENKSERPSVSPASIVQIKQDLEIPNGKSRVYMQDGVVNTLRNINKRSAYCSVLMQKQQADNEPKRIVSPGQFTVTKVIETNNYSGSRRTYVASLGWILEVANKTRPRHINFGIEMLLQSTDQPGVRSLICEKRSENAFNLYEYPTLEQIRNTLGNLIEIKTP
jgi:hypothetical protein